MIRLFRLMDQSIIRDKLFDIKSKQHQSIMSSKSNKQSPVAFVQQASNDREFRCKCSKIYKSYPALYTHIKNKHPNQILQFKNQSKRPKEGQIDKGRPKKHRDRPIQADQQGNLLNIIQLGIMEIQNNLRNQIYSNTHQDKFQTLKGNAKLKDQELNHHYKINKTLVCDKIIQNLPQDDTYHLMPILHSKNLSNLKNEASFIIFKEKIKFKSELIQHFNAVTAAKILIELQLLQIEKETLDSNQNINKHINLIDSKTMFVKEAQKALWGKNQLIIQIIRGIYTKWHSKISSFEGPLTHRQMHSYYSALQLPSEGQQSEVEDQQSASNNQQENGEDQNGLDDMIDSCIN